MIAFSLLNSCLLNEEGYWLVDTCNNQQYKGEFPTTNKDLLKVCNLQTNMILQSLLCITYIKSYLIKCTIDYKYFFNSQFELSKHNSKIYLTKTKYVLPSVYFNPLRAP